MQAALAGAAGRHHRADVDRPRRRHPGGRGRGRRAGDATCRGEARARRPPARRLARDVRARRRDAPRPPARGAASTPIAAPADGAVARRARRAARGRSWPRSTARHAAGDAPAAEAAPPRRRSMRTDRGCRLRRAAGRRDQREAAAARGAATLAVARPRRGRRPPPAAAPSTPSSIDLDRVRPRARRRRAVAGAARPSSPSARAGGSPIASPPRRAGPPLRPAAGGRGRHRARAWSRCGQQRRRTATVVAVDDDPMILDTLRVLLADGDVKVLVAVDDQEQFWRARARARSPTSSSSTSTCPRSAASSCAA